MSIKDIPDMTLRDYFAGQVITWPYRGINGSDKKLDQLTEFAYDVADSMLRTRKKATT